MTYVLISIYVLIYFSLYLFTLVIINIFRILDPPKQQQQQQTEDLSNDGASSNILNIFSFSH